MTRPNDSAFNDGYRAALDSVLKGIEREQSYRVYRADKVLDQDGSAIGACKEIAGYVRVLLAELAKVKS